jgi:hypothetical protein
MTLRYKNNVACTLAASMTDSAVTISLTPGDGAQLPVIASGTADTFLITVTDKNGNREIISICRRDSGSDTLYVGTGTSHQAAGSITGRAQEGTTAIAVTYTDDHAISMCPTAGPFEAAVKYSDAGELTVSTAILNYLSTAGITLEDLQKLHAITATAGNINTTIPSSTARNEHVHTNIGITASDGLEVSRANLGAAVDVGLANYTAGDRYVFASLVVVGMVTTSSYVKTFEVQIDRGGTLRIVFSLRAGGSGKAYGRIYRNGSAVGTERSTSSETDVVFSEDISGWTAGDLVQIYAKVVGGGSTQKAYISNVYLKSGNVYKVVRVG